MIDYNRKLSNERETQVPSHRMSTLVLLEALIFTLYTLMDFSFKFETINLGRPIVNIKGSQVIIPK